MKKYLFWSELVVATTALSSAFAGVPSAKVDAMLKEFSKNPREFMNAPVKKWSANGQPGRTVFAPEDVKSGEFVLQRAQLRKKLFPTATGGGRAAMGANDMARALVDNGDSLVDRLADMTKLESA